MNTMNTTIARTQFSATRGPSMAAQHACPQSIVSARSCDALGLCQSRQPACADCSLNHFRFAPGVIEYGAALPKKLSLRKTLAMAAALGLTLGALGRWMGWI